LATPGCLDKPSLEDLWTRIDVESSNVAQGQALAPGSAQLFDLDAAITYRAILTGFAVAELRSSPIPASEVMLAPDAPRERMAQAIARPLANSTSCGRAVRAVTGWAHLIQRLDFSFTGAVPTTLGAGDGTLFLVCYLGSGVKIEIPGQADSIAVTPFAS